MLGWEGDGGNSGVSLRIDMQPDAYFVFYIRLATN